MCSMNEVSTKTCKENSENSQASQETPAARPMTVTAGIPPVESAESNRMKNMKILNFLSVTS